MRGKLVQLLTVVGVAAGGLGVGAVSASAVDVGTQAAPTGPPSTITLLAGVSTVQIVQSNAAVVNCQVTAFGMHFNSGSYPTLPAVVGDAQMLFSQCSGPGSRPSTITCSSAGAVDIVGPPVGSWFALTPVTLSGISCSYTVPSLSCSATLSGSLTGEYRNPLGATRAAMVLDGTSGLSIGGTTCPATISNGPITLKPAGSSLPLVYSMGSGPPASSSGIDDPFVS